jgi:hypothetical protein
VKLRAERRAAELGKSLAQVYREAGVNKTYLSEVPTVGWRRDKVEAIAAALGWSIDQLIGAEGRMPRAHVSPNAQSRDRRKPRDAPEAEAEPPAPIDLLEYAIEVAIEIYSRTHDRPPPAQTARLARRLHDLLLMGGPQPSRQWLLNVGLLLAADINDSGKTSG